MMRELRKNALVEEFDHNLLMDCLKSYSQPYKKVTRLLASEDIIRVKKGLYVFGEEYAKEPYSTEVLANLIYGPSYISLEFALSWYGLIPERVYTVTSMTTRKNKLFKTPVGRFSYKYLNPKKYSVSVDLIALSEHRNVLMATKEKALCDFISQQKGFTNLQDMSDFLFENMRIDPEIFYTLRKAELKKINRAYKSNSIELLITLRNKNDE
ncbi:MAG: putative transcriptional regulator of viral defense system [Chlamydiales bacterium]|jgi:predicted transcriptional regulator of viral defense system